MESECASPASAARDEQPLPSVSERMAAWHEAILGSAAGVPTEEEEHVESESASPASAARDEQSLPNVSEHMAAWHETMVAVDDAKPHLGIFTYYPHSDDVSCWTHYMLAKLVPYLAPGSDLAGPDQATGLLVHDFPGGVATTYTSGETRVTVEIAPLLAGRDTKEQDGAAQVRLETAPPTPCLLRCGDGDKVEMIGWKRSLVEGIWVDAMAMIGRAGMARDSFTGAENLVSVVDDVAVLGDTRQPFKVAVVSSGTVSAGQESSGGRFLEIHFPDGKGEATFAFALGEAQAIDLARRYHGPAAWQAVQDYYARLLSSHIETPDAELNGAFRSAIYNLEYCWHQPYGWTEVLHHWFEMWHMQQALGADWIGQTDRSRMTTISQAERLYPNGAVPMLRNDGGVYRAWGGTNQFFAWQIRHYWEHTADRAFIEQMAPVLDRVIAQTFAEYDPEGDLLLAWREQIGNQEDYVSHPHNSTSPSVEGINMLRTRQMLAQALGDEATAARCEASIAAASHPAARGALAAGSGTLPLLQGPARHRPSGWPVPDVHLPGDLRAAGPSGRLDKHAAPAGALDRRRGRGLRLEQLPQPRQRDLGHAGGRRAAALGRLGSRRRGSAQRSLPPAPRYRAYRHERPAQGQLARGRDRRHQSLSLAAGRPVHSGHRRADLRPASAQAGWLRHRRAVVSRRMAGSQVHRACLFRDLTAARGTPCSLW